MATLPPVPNVIRVQMKHSVGADKDVLVRAYYQWSGTAPTNTTLTTFAASVETAYSTNLKALMSSVNSLTEVIVEDLTSATGAVGIWSGSLAGTRSATYVPAGVCAVLNFQIARRYRGGKPKCYFPWGVQADLTSTQAWGSSFTSAVNTGWAAFNTAVIAAAWSGATITSQVNVSYYKGFTVVTNPITGRARNVPTVRGTPVTDAILTATCATAVGSQRRRNRTGL